MFDTTSTQTDALIEGNETSDEEAPKGDTVEDEINKIEPRIEERVWKLGTKDNELIFVQRTLPTMRRLEWYALVSRTLEKALGGRDGITVDDMLNTDTESLDAFVKGIFRIAGYAPSFISQSFAIWLNVPRHQREVFEHYVNLPVEEGGPDDEWVLGVIETFFNQNMTEMKGFFSRAIGTFNRIWTMMKTM